MRHIIHNVVVPCAVRRRQKLVAFEEEETGVAADPTKQRRIILSFDGENDYLKASLDLLVDNAPPEWQGAGIELLKWAASASKYQQPCDVSSSYMVLKQSEMTLQDLTPARYTSRAEALLVEHLTPASARTYTRFLSRLQDLLSKSFTSVHIKMGWQRAGVWPKNDEKILCRCTTFKYLQNEQAAAVMAAIPQLTALAMLSGEISDESMQLAVGNVLDFDEWVSSWSVSYVKPKTQLEKQAINRRRVIWLNHEGVTNARRAKESARILEEEQKKAAAEARRIARIEKDRLVELKKRKREEAATLLEEKRRKKAARLAEKQTKANAKRIVVLSSGRQLVRPSRFDG